jgi:KaiC/GvpD/RAD55 family RecA-like ATPase/DNA-binding transcriptional ArsR family regulator
MQRADLAEILRGEVPEPDMLADGTLYRGAVHLLAGQPDSGKTTLGACWALAVIRKGGSVMFLDEEGGKLITADRLASAGWTADEAESVAYYPFPGRTRHQWTREGWADLADELREHRPDMILIDSAAATLAAAGLDENSNADVAVLWYALMMMARTSWLRPAVVIIDHVTKAEPEGRYSRGASAKLAMSDVMYRADVLRAWSRYEDGAVRLVVTKDRPGWLRRHQRLRVLRNPLRFEPDELAGDTADAGTWPPAKAKILEALDPSWRTVTELTDRIHARHGHGLKRQTVSTHLTELERDGWAERRDTGPGRPALWRRSGAEAPDARPPVTPGQADRLLNGGPLTEPPATPGEPGPAP